MPLRELMGILDAEKILLFFEDGDVETFTGTEQETMIEEYGHMWGNRLSCFAEGIEMQVGNGPKGAGK